MLEVPVAVTAQSPTLGYGVTDCPFLTLFQNIPHCIVAVAVIGCCPEYPVAVAVHVIEIGWLKGFNPVVM